MQPPSVGLRSSHHTSELCAHSRLHQHVWSDYLATGHVSLLGMGKRDRCDRGACYLIEDA